MRTMRAPGKPSRRRSRAVLGALKKEGSSAASPPALAEHARAVARRRGPAALRRSALKAARARGARR